MDLQTAVAASMLPASRARIAAAFRGPPARAAQRPPLLELLWSACGRSEPLPSASRIALLDAAARAGRRAEDGDRGGWPCDVRYPALLACIPIRRRLWVRGKLDILARPTVAVIGSRRAATPYALEVGTRIAAELAERGVVVASGWPEASTRPRTGVPRRPAARQWQCRGPDSIASIPRSTTNWRGR